MEIETGYYLDKFQKSLDQLEKKGAFSQKNLESKVGIWLDSVVLKIQKKSWINASAKPFGEGIFFSVWLNDESLGKGKLYYNIHALKLRELKGYVIKSREFAEAFRLKFKSFENRWPNVGVRFGPLTLMEGWVDIEHEHIENLVADLAFNFLEITFIIDDLLEKGLKTQYY
ncbi:hypothetical protein SAMN05421820_103747 [Pedobacter steynii]|uniref:DUF4268 domain-containing protein n=1 Tax=Pedobacter steynii TaxID=430522 RepID=A0A1G9SYW0_9SPHI|nr:hypothetical protein [Pedobacter steynii]NQX37283.1 hypothetical protein [Pedobacter steynii]SDM40641.1 hypothetical protein SAMN05421820_103747 [Pedobacter steynii]